MPAPPEPRVAEALSDEEACLLAVLTDSCGLDLAEFSWYDAESPDGCWRARPYQWTWWRDKAPLQIDQCSRDVGKTTGIIARANAFPFCHPGGEMVITAPELVHLMPLTDAIERVFHETRLGTEIMPKGRSKMIRRPFRMNFTTGARIIGRIPQVSGRAVKGLHPVALEMDEASDYPEKGWIELTATLRRGIKGAMWRAHGVTRGIRDKFYEFTQPSADNPWKVHRIVAMHRDDWSDEERQQNIVLYGSREAPDYRRNILGLHGDPANALFVLSRLMRCVDTEEASEYNTEEYRRIVITGEQLDELIGLGEGVDSEDVVARQIAVARQLLDFGDLPQRYEVFWAGMDVGYTLDPSEILVAAEYLPTAEEMRADRVYHRAIPDKGVSRLRVVVRIQLKRVSNPVQVAIVGHVIRSLKPRAFGLDKTGNGIGLFMDLQGEEGEVAAVVRGYNFSEKVIVGIDGTVEVTERDDVLKEAALKSNVLEYSTDMLREIVDKLRWMMPFDRDMLREFQGQTWAYANTLNSMDAYGRPRRIFSTGNFHTLDAARMLAMAHAQAPIEEIVRNLKHPNQEPVLDVALW